MIGPPSAPIADLGAALHFLGHCVNPGLSRLCGLFQPYSETNMIRNQTKPFRPLASLACASLMSVGTLLAASLLSQPAQAQSASESAASYCKSTGGKVLTWHYWAGSEQFGAALRSCQYRGDPGGDGYNSSITVDLETLASTRATLAALAYYKRVPFDTTKMQPGMNPAKVYCQQLGGTTDQAGELDGRGMQWQVKPVEDWYGPMCVFSDRSVIDAWGLTYMQNGALRGIDLGTVLQWKNPFPTTRR